MTKIRPEVLMPDPFVFVTEAPGLTPIGSPPYARERVCEPCGHRQVTLFGHSVMREYHWCDRRTGLHFVVWNPV
jgi:hypothetical protein